MRNPIIQLEERTGLNATQAALLLAIPKPTYYQYRREGVMPPCVLRMLAFVANVDDKRLDSLIEEFVFDNGL